MVRGEILRRATELNHFNRSYRKFQAKFLFFLPGTGFFIGENFSGHLQFVAGHLLIRNWPNNFHKHEPVRIQNLRQNIFVLLGLEVFDIVLEKKHLSVWKKSSPFRPYVLAGYEVSNRQFLPQEKRFRNIAQPVGSLGIIFTDNKQNHNKE